MSPVHCNVLSIQLGTASAKRYLKTAGLCGIAIFVDVGYLIYGHQTHLLRHEARPLRRHWYLTSRPIDQ